MQLFHEQKIETAEGVTYTPFVYDGRVGYSLHWPDGTLTYLYLNPSTEDSDGVSNVFIYDGPSPEIMDGVAISHIIPAPRSSFFDHGDPNG